MHVVFLEFPSNATFFVKENSTLTCVVKAAEGATVRWLFDGQPLPLVEGSAAVCSDGNSSNVTRAIVLETQLPGNFTIFHAELVVRYYRFYLKCLETNFSTRLPCLGYGQKCPWHVYWPMIS